MAEARPAPTHGSLAAARTTCVLTYGLALLAAVGVAVLLAGRHPITIAALADLVATLVVFAVSLTLRNSSFYDPFWSVAPPLLVGFWWLGAGSTGSDPVRCWLVLALVTAWSLRLTFNWLRRWRGFGDEDFRYRQLRQQSGRWYPLVNLFGIHLFPTVVVFLGCLPLFLAVALPSRPLGVLDALATLMVSAAIGLELVADQQLRRFLDRPGSAGTILAEGLWAHVRHPNYVGEILFWWGLFLFGLAAEPAWAWSAVGALAIHLMFLWASVPMMNRRGLLRRPGYAEHMQRVPALLPRPWRSMGDPT